MREKSVDSGASRRGRAKTLELPSVKPIASPTPEKGGFLMVAKCEHDGDCGIQRDIYSMLGDWRYPNCRKYCDLHPEEEASS